VKYKLRLDGLIRGTVNQAHTQAMGGKIPYYYPEEIVRRVAGLPAIAHAIAQVSGSGFELEIVIQRYITAKVTSILRTTKDATGQRAWQSYHVPGRVDNRWLPAPMLTPELCGQISASYRKRGNKDLKLAELYDLVRIVALEKGYGQAQVITKDYEWVVGEAKQRMAA
jgi:hypothetical protein